MSAILEGCKLDNEKFAAIRIHQQYNIPSHRRDKGLISHNVLSNKYSIGNDHKESLNLKYQEQLLALKECELALREREAKVYSVELVNLEKEQALKPAS
ncbi:hypothetical protein F8M41_021041 [Gigaspora margarita]|uniref:Uncharacterized protein n=1 Tax=Gigaspora margarita TaxID=4874 RepID=A0A8H4AHI1_GIGMA|nr:hypothetical protein F8M41_021041 [Gigaspora margarita]